MTHIPPAHASRHKSLTDWLILGEAGILLLIARFALKTLPTARIVQWVRRPLRRTVDLVPGTDLEQIRWAVTAFSRNAPIRLVCFPQALAMHAMLRRRGIASEVLYGAARLEDGKLATHAWLRAGDRLLVGGEVSSSFTVLDTWTPENHSGLPK